MGRCTVALSQPRPTHKTAMASWMGPGEEGVLIFGGPQEDHGGGGRGHGFSGRPLERPTVAEGAGKRRCPPGRLSADKIGGTFW